jgi:hypothetical protein
MQIVVSNPRRRLSFFSNISCTLFQEAYQEAYQAQSDSRKENELRAEDFSEVEKLFVLFSVFNNSLISLFCLLL